MHRQSACAFLLGGASMLERPLTTARGDKKSYIYANFNPKYAQYMVTILRTYYNFADQ